MYCQCKEQQKHGRGGLTQISPMDTEGFGYHPQNRCIRSLSPLTPPLSCVNPCHDERQPRDNPPTHGVSLISNHTRCPPTIASRESCSSTHTQTCDPQTHIPPVMVNPSTQDTGLSSQANTASLDQGPHHMREPASLFSVCSPSPACHFPVISVFPTHLLTFSKHSHPRSHITM